MKKRWKKSNRWQSPANVKVAGLEEAMDEMKELVALLEKARSLVSDLAKELSKLSVEIKI